MLTLAWQKTHHVLAQVSVEPVMALYYFCYGLYLVILQAMFLDRVCRVNLDQPDQICSHLHEEGNKQVLDQVQAK